jgi:hypothetical protein
MSRGLSQQQRQILGIAAHVNRLTQGGTLAVKTGAPVPHYRIPTVDYGGVKDLQWPLAAHLVHGLPWVAVGTLVTKSNGVEQPAGAYFDGHDRRVQRAKTSTIRAITSLWKRGFLVLAPLHGLCRWGYVLSAAGLALGQQYESPFAPPLVFRAGLILAPNCPQPPFDRIAARLATGALTLATVVQALQPDTPCPVEVNWHRPDPDAEHQYWQWLDLYEQERCNRYLALFGDEGLGLLPPPVPRLRRTPAP